ncbi:MAG: DMT family transporter [Crocinitomicaceae bacterium]|nr:DMT family transporter [Crocinitomicaceae bacterium]
MAKKYQYHILMHLIILVWGFTGILGKLIHLSPEVIVWYRVIIATLGLLLFLPLLKIPLGLKNKRDIWKLILIGIVTSAHWVCFYKAIALSTASLGILCLSTTTLHVTWLEPIIMKRKFSWLEFALGLLVIYGIYFVSSDFKGDEYIALAYGLVAALLAAIFSVSNARLVKSIPSPQITFYEMLTGIVFLTILLFFSDQLTIEALKMTTTDFWLLIFLGLVCTSLAYILMINVANVLGAFTASLTINMEPVYTIFLAIILLKENQLLNTNFYIGSFMIIAIVVINTIIKISFSSKEKKLNLF